VTGTFGANQFLNTIAMNSSSTYFNKTLSILLCLGLLISACSKDDDDETASDPTPQQEESADTYPTPSDADGTLVAVKSTSITDTPIGPITTIIGTAVAVFTDDGFTSGTWISAGNVSCNAQDLTLNPNNSYVFTDISQTNPLGLDFNSEVLWDVSGGNGIASFNIDANPIGFPVVGEITSSEIVETSDGYTMTCASVSGADSVIFVIGGTTKTLAGNATSCTFTSAELQSLATGPSVAQVAAYVMAPNDFGDTRIYTVNEAVQTKSVTVQ
jgi:hypothetical protein